MWLHRMFNNKSKEHQSLGKMKGSEWHSNEKTMKQKLRKAKKSSQTLRDAWKSPEKPQKRLEKLWTV